MGSFNVNCFVTKQIIIPHDSVVLFPIEISLENNSTLGIHADVTIVDRFTQKSHIFNKTFNVSTNKKKWVIAGPMLTGTYADYGCFNIDNTKANKDALKTFFSKLNLFNVQSVKFNDNKKFFLRDSIKNNGLNTFEGLQGIWNDFYSLIQENIAFSASLQEITQLNVAVMHKHTYNMLLRKKYENVTYKQYFHNSFSYEIDKQDKNCEKRSYSSLELLRRELASLTALYLPNSYRISEIYDLCEKAYNIDINTDNIKKGPFLNILYKLVEDAYKLCYVLNNIAQYNLPLEPVTYTGQDYNNHTGNDYLKLVKAVNTNINKEILRYTKNDK